MSVSRAPDVSEGPEDARSPDAEARAGGAIAPEGRLRELRATHRTRGLALEPRGNALAAEDVLRTDSGHLGAGQSGQIRTPQWRRSGEWNPS